MCHRASWRFHRAGKRPSRVYGHATARAVFLICGRHASNCATHNDATAVLTREWDRPEINVPLVIVDSPYRELSRPVIGYIRALPDRGPRDVVTVMIPEYVAAGWWEQRRGAVGPVRRPGCCFTGRAAPRLTARLLGDANVVVTSIAWHERRRRLPSG